VHLRGMPLVGLETKYYASSVDVNVTYAEFNGKFQTFCRDLWRLQPGK
jgi:hypothetical protein